MIIGKKEVKEYVLESGIGFGRSRSEEQPIITLESRVVSRVHGEFLIDGEKAIIRDLGSSNGTTVNGVYYGTGADLQEKQLEDGDVIRIDVRSQETMHEDAVLMIYRYTEVCDVNWASLELREDANEFCVGRNEQNSDIYIRDSRVSRRHAVFYRAVNGWAIKDCDSSNGVFLNNQRLEQPKYLKRMDCVRILDTLFVYQANQLLIGMQPDTVFIRPRENISSQKNLAGGKDLSIHIRRRTAKQGLKTITLLKDIDLTVHAGEMVLILGGSGAGKTTFMNAVMGYERADGTILHGDVDVYANYQQMKYEIGFVPQDILLRESDSVYDTLYNAAQMKMPLQSTTEQRKARVEQVLEMVNLSHVSRSLIRSISGGEKKRVSAGVELVADPSLFFLDEPDSGLDAQSAIELMENLRKIADTGKIVMIISHSPDRVAEMFDKVIVLAKSQVDLSGHLAFFGSVPQSYQFFGAESLEGIVSKVNARDGQREAFIERWRCEYGR